MSVVDYQKILFLFFSRDLNGLTLCYKVGTNTNAEIISRNGSKPVPQLAYSLHPKGPPTNGNSNFISVPPRRAPAEKPPSHTNGSGYQNVVLGDNDDSPHEYEQLVIAPLSPKRPAPQPPVVSMPFPTRPAPKLPSAMSTYSTLGTYQGKHSFPVVNVRSTM